MNFSMPGPFALVLGAVLLTGCASDASRKLVPGSAINERDRTSFDGSFPGLTSGPACPGGGTTVLLSGGNRERPMRVGICEWVKTSTPSGFTYRQRINYQTIPVGGVTNMPIGCDIPGFVVHRLAWSDVGSAYTPEDLFAQPWNALTLLRSRGRPPEIVQNRHASKVVFIDILLGNHTEMHSIDPGSTFIIADGITRAWYQVPYSAPNLRACE
jgi:hypothetical protein